jgi:peptide/nickel transport system permease protein
VTLAYVLRRLFQVVPVVAGILALTFLMIQLVPGDAVEALAGENASPAYLDALRIDYGLDRPLPQQFLAYVGNVLQGDLGVSVLQARPVGELIAERLQPTLLLMVTALVISSAGALVLGGLAARRPFGGFDLGVSTMALAGYSMPVFWLGQLAVMALALRADLFPVQGFTDAAAQYSGWPRVLDIAHHLVVPVLVLAASEVALLARVTRTGLLQELRKDYIRTARAKGAGDGRVVARHALPNTLLSVLTVVGGRIGFLFSGAVLVETVFAWPGLGGLLVEASRAQDHPVVLGMVLLVSLSVVVANLVTDLIYARIDPRIRYR